MSNQVVAEAQNGKSKQLNKVVYTKLCDVEGSRIPGQQFNVYGIIIESTHKISYDYLNQYQNEYRLKLKDGTNKECINVTIFAILEAMPRIPFNKGNIVRFHRLFKKSFKKSIGFYLYGKLGPVSALMFEPPKIGEKFADIPTFRNTEETQSQEDDEILAELINKYDEIFGSAQTVLDMLPPTKQFPNTVFHIGPTQLLLQKDMPLTISDETFFSSQSQESVFKPTIYRYLPIIPDVNSKSRKHETCIEIRQMAAANYSYYNFMCQVVSCYKNSRGNVFLRVWDGTQNAMKTHMTYRSNLEMVFGDLSREIRIAATKRLYEVCCYDEHGESAQKLKKDKNFPALVLHRGEGSITTARGEHVSAGRRISIITEDEAAQHYNFIQNNIKIGEAIINQDHSEDDFEQDLVISDVELRSINDVGKSSITTFGNTMGGNCIEKLSLKRKNSSSSCSDAPSTKRTRITKPENLPQHGEMFATQTLFERLKPTSAIQSKQSDYCQEEEEIDEIELGAPTELQRSLDEITPSQEERMWNLVANFKSF